MDGQDGSDDDVDVAEASSLTKLDSCTVQVDPPMTAAMEHLRLPENLMNQLHIVADVTPTGLVLTGELAQITKLTSVGACISAQELWLCTKG